MSVVLGEEIGRGSYARVYRLSIDGRDYALKHIERSYKSGAIAPFEGYIATSVRSPYLVETIQINFDSEGNLQLIQPLALGDASSYRGKLKGESLKVWLWNLCLGIYELHRNGIVHGDIKASNILVYKDGLRLSDFSVSVVNHSRRMAYTSTHRPPEVRRGEEWSYPADIWALGCTIYELAYGDVPFDKDGTCKSHRIHAPSRRLDRLIHSMLREDPSARIGIEAVLRHEYFGVKRDIPPVVTKDIYVEAVSRDLYDRTCGRISTEVCKMVASKLFGGTPVLSQEEQREEIELYKLLNFKLL